MIWGVVVYIYINNIYIIDTMYKIDNRKKENDLVSTDT